ncbi:DUF3566 domain-containing protein [Nocardioidaceae bacterium SCSIO 66511]|nr:DUF3566 domain-containing protein [Nocardioidaceae bacterium SCSIO 66511]
MTDRKPQGSTPVAPQRPKSSSPQPGSSNNPGESTAKQSTQRVNGASPKNASRPAQTAAPAKSKPKTAGEIAAEAPQNPPPAANQKPAVQQSTPPPKRAPEPAPATAADAAAARTARLRLARIDPWSVMKVSFALSIALAIVTVIAISIVWFVLGAAGVWDAVNSSVASLLSDDAETFDITEYVGYPRVIGFALLVSAVDVVLITAIATLGAFLYNLAASLLGGLELTLAEDT